MKKTLTVNLGGTVYHIDEDAYMLLDNYLKNLKIHYRKEEGADEILKDIEQRISELFSEKIVTGSQVITIDNVEDVIARMGKPEELWEEEGNPQRNESERKGGSASPGAQASEQVHRRLYRNPDDRILGGVAGGVAAYMGWDPTLVRIIMILLLGVPYFSVVLVYIICWILIPLASTATEKLAMKGESATVENIGKTVTDGFEKMADGVNNYIKSDKPRNTLQKIGDVIVQIIGLMLKVLLIFIGIVLSPALFVMVIVFIALIFSAFGILSAGPAILIDHLSPVVNWAEVGTLPMALFGIAGVLFVGIPLFSIIYVAFKSVFHWNQMNTGWKWTLIVLWILALGGVIGFCSWVSLTIPNWGYFV